MTGRVICFSGKIGSGKSSVSASVAKGLDCKLASFGGYIRHMVEMQDGDPKNRQALQDYGQGRVERDIEAFCRDVLKHANYQNGEDLVVDGIRHVDVFSTLSRLLPDCTVSLIHLDLDDNLRRSRMAGRGDDRADFSRAENHTVEQDLQDSLPMRADLIIDVSAPLNEVVEKCLRFTQMC